ncbi:hypothetical protein D3C75_1036460 [compost metagenome]
MIPAVVTEGVKQAATRPLRTGTTVNILVREAPLRVEFCREPVNELRNVGEGKVGLAVHEYSCGLALRRAKLPASQSIKTSDRDRSCPQ